MCEKEDNLFSKTAKNIIELESKTCEKLALEKGNDNMIPKNRMNENEDILRRKVKCNRAFKLVFP